MTLEERVEALEKELQKMKDIEAIKELKGKYFRCLDGKMWDELETTLSPNIVTSYSNGKLVFHSPKEGQWYILETGYVRIYEEHFMRDPKIHITMNMHK